MGSESVKAELHADLVSSHVSPPVEVAQRLATRGGEHQIIRRRPPTRAANTFATVRGIAT